jgi:hypothetical protein
MSTSPAYTMLDLCCGAGGAHKPARDRGWRVVSLDLVKWFKPSVVADVRALPFKPFHVDLLWVSPPCQEFAKWRLRHLYPRPHWPSLDLMRAARAAIEYFQPRMWVIENVRCSHAFLYELLGPPRVLLSGHALWSDRLLLVPRVMARKVDHYHAGVRAAWRRALIPYDLAEPIIRQAEVIAQGEVGIG